MLQPICGVNADNYIKIHDCRLNTLWLIKVYVVIPEK